MSKHTCNKTGTTSDGRPLPPCVACQEYFAAQQQRQLSKVIKALSETIPTEGEMLDQAHDLNDRLTEKLRVAEADLATYDRAIAQFDTWLGEQVDAHKLHPVCSKVYRDVAAKFQHTLRTVRAVEPQQDSRPAAS